MRIFILIITISIIQSCASDKKNEHTENKEELEFYNDHLLIHLMIDSSLNICKSNPVMKEGLQVGMVEEVKYLEDKKVLKLSLSENISKEGISKSNFKISADLLGACSVLIEPADSVIHDYKYSDTIKNVSYDLYLDLNSNDTSRLKEKVNSLVEEVNEVLEEIIDN